MKNINNRQKKKIVPKQSFKRENLRQLRQMAQKKRRQDRFYPPTLNATDASELETDEGKQE